MNVNPDLNLNFAQRHLPFKINNNNNFPSLMFNMNKSNRSNLLLKTTPMINSFFNSQNKNNNLNKNDRDKIGINENDIKINDNSKNESNSSSNKKRNSNNNNGNNSKNNSKYNSSSLSKNSNKNKMGNKSNSSKILSFSGTSNSKNISRKATKKYNKKASKKASKRSSKNSNSKDNKDNKDKENEINSNANNNNNDEQKNNENNIQRNKKHQLTLSQIRVYQRNNTINNTNMFEFKNLLNKASKINFGQNKIKLNLGNLSPSHSKKNLPVIRNKKDNMSHPKYVYSYEESSDSNYNNNVLFLSKFSINNNDESNNLKLVKCVKQKGAELFLSPVTRNFNRNYSKDYLVTLNKLKFTSSNFCINSAQPNKYIRTTNTFKYSNRNNSENMTNEKYVSTFNINSRNNNKLKTHITNTLSDINLNIYNSSKNTFSSKNLQISNKNSSKNNLDEFMEIRKKKKIEKDDSNNDTDFINELNAFSDDEIKSCSTNKYGIPIPTRRRRENTISMNSTTGQNFGKNFDSIGMHSSKNLFNRPKKYSFRHMLSERNLINDKGFLNSLRTTSDNNDYIQDNSGKNIYVRNRLFKHTSREFKKLNYKEKDYINHQKEKIENKIENDEFTNRSSYSDKLILIKKEFLDKDISNFIENKSKEIIPKNYFDTEREILFDEKNKENEDYLYNVFKEPDKYISNLIYKHCNLNKIINKRYFKHFYPSNKIKKIQTNAIHINETNKLNYKENKNFIIQFIKEKYNFYPYIYKTIIYRRDLKKLISRRIKSKVIKNKNNAQEFEEDRKCSESYNIIKISLYFNEGLYKFISSIQKPFGQIEYKRRKAWNIIEREPIEKQMNKKQKRSSINLGKGGRRQSTYLNILKGFKPKESDKEKPKIEKKSTSIFPGRMRMSISGDLNIKPKDFGSNKDNKDDGKKKSIASSKSYKFKDSNGLNKVKNDDIIIEEKSVDESSSHSVMDDAKSRKLNKSRNFISKKISSYSSSESSDSSSGKLIIEDFEEMDKKINKYKFSTNKKMFGRNDILKRESLNTRLNKLLQEENYYKKSNSNNEKKNEIIIRLAGYDTLTKEAMSIKVKELEEKSPTVQLFNKFVLIIEKRKENLFEELLNEEEKKYKQLKKNFNEFLNMQQSYTGNTLLIYAAQNGVKNIAQSLLMRNCDPNIQNIFGNTALHLAYKTNNMALVYLLKGFGALENIKNESGLRPVQMTFFEKSIL